MDKTKTQRDLETTYIKIVDSSYTIITRAASYEDEWDKDDTETIHNIEGFTLVKDSFYDLAINFKPEKNKVYYLVYAIYSTGDSYGSTAGGQIEFIDLFTIDSAANACAKKARETKGNNFSYINEALAEVRQYCPWRGYFEVLNGVYVETVFLLNKED